MADLLQDFIDLLGSNKRLCGEKGVENPLNVFWDNATTCVANCRLDKFTVAAYINMDFFFLSPL